MAADYQEQSELHDDTHRTNSQKQASKPLDKMVLSVCGGYRKFPFYTLHSIGQRDLRDIEVEIETIRIYSDQLGSRPALMPKSTTTSRQFLEAINDFQRLRKVKSNNNNNKVSAFRFVCIRPANRVDEEHTIRILIHCCFHVTRSIKSPIN